MKFKKVPVEVVVALNAKDPNIKAVWADVKAAMSWNPDFGARLVLDVAKERRRTAVASPACGTYILASARRADSESAESIER